MTAVVATSALVDVLRYMVNKAAPESLILRLFVNDVHPSVEDGAGRFDEATFQGYAQVELAAGGWEVLEGGRIEARHAQHPFVRTVRGQLQQAYGYYLTRERSGRIAWAERFPTPAPMLNAGDTVLVTPRIAVRLVS